jgi:FkbM family methyltransferase
MRRALRTVLERRGFWIRRRSVLPYGIDYQLDIERLSALYSVPITVFFDIGANVGQTSRAALHSFPHATVYAFEPDAKSFASLSANVTGTRFRAFMLALSDRSGNASFFDYGPFATSNSLVADSQFAARTKNAATERVVQCETLDDLCARLSIDHIDVLKVDAEGHDLAVLVGGKRLFAEQRVRFVYVEYNTVMPREGTSGGALVPISSLLESAGFKFVASYPEYMITSGEFFVTSNALFFRETT